MPISRPIPPTTAPYECAVCKRVPTSPMWFVLPPERLLMPGHWICHECYRQLWYIAAAVAGVNQHALN